jgi:sigma-E factor negative regulatory protein RseA
MSVQIGEQLSSFMDGETLPTEHEFLVRRLEQEAGLKERWDHYHRIRDVLHGQHRPEVTANFAQRVMVAVAAEPAYDHREGAQWGRMMRPVAGVAVAATVASLAILWAQHSPLSEPATPVIAQNAPAQIQTQSQPFIQPTPAASIQPWVNNYLVDHHEYSVGPVMPGIMSYTRIVGFENGVPK